MRRLAVVVAVAVLVAACDQKKSSNESAIDAQPPLSISTSATTTATTTATTSASAEKKSEGPITDLVVGTGAEAVSGKKITVHYTMWVAPKDVDGEPRKIESSHDTNKPKTFMLGAGGVIKGWDDGIPGMRVGGKRRLVVPPQLGYGPAGSPPSIPGNATLIFEIELLDVKG